MRQKDVISAYEPSQLVEQKHRIVLDTDIGDNVDDALALVLALKSPEIDLRGITTVFGDTQKRAQLAQHILHIFGREDIPVAVGVGKPLHQRHIPSGVAQAEILDDSPFDRERFSALSGPELLVQQALEYSGEITLVCIGPLTNVALALLIEPRIEKAIRNIVMMGGSSGLPLRETNVSSDVRAAQIVLSSGIPITMLGLNITRHCQLHKQDIEQLRESTLHEANMLYQLITIWQQHCSRWQSKLPFLHDPLTIAALCMPELVQFKDMRVHVIERGPFQGIMMPHILGDFPVRAAIDVQANKTRDWVMQRLLAVQVDNEQR